ncbi:MAG: dodecin family protein [Dethiobacteraceae bacterium]|jgi:flavin-binding protein dodecin|nr:dodecin domain-containing protein [Bacillota bacterium]
MSVAKIIELVGESSKSFEDAVKNAVAEAARTIENITGVEVHNLTAQVKDGEIVEYKANVRLAFGVKR